VLKRAKIKPMAKTNSASSMNQHPFLVLSGGQRARPAGCQRRSRKTIHFKTKNGLWTFSREQQLVVIGFRRTTID
jgi:hypothetical protein